MLVENEQFSVMQHVMRMMMMMTALLFMLFLQECTMKVQEGKFKLQDLLVVPMQRVLKYHLLLKVRSFLLTSSILRFTQLNLI